VTIPCTCCEPTMGFQQEGEDAKPVCVMRGDGSGKQITQVLCRACAMMCGGTREDYEAAGLTVIAIREPTEEEQEH